MVHSCFSSCRPKVYSEYDSKAFTIDERPLCPDLADEVEEYGLLGHILCLTPFLNEENCETY